MIEDWIKKMHIHNGILPAITKDEILPLAT